MKRTSKERKVKDMMNVDCIKDGQPRNPYTEIQVLTQHKDIVRLLIQIKPIRCASAGDDCHVIIWDLEVGRRLHVLPGHRRPVTCMCVMEKPESNVMDNVLEPTILLTGASDKQIFAWNVDAGSCLFTVLDHDGPIRALITMPEHDVFCGAGENLCLWDRDGRILTKFNRREEEDIQDILLMREDMLVTIVDRQVAIHRINLVGQDGSEKWQIRLVRKLPEHREPIRSLVKINNGCFASGSLDGSIVMWTVPALSPSRCFNRLTDYQGEDRMYPYSIQHMMVAEERYLFAAIGNGFCVFDAISGRLMAQKLNAHLSKILHIKFVNKSTILATCSEDSSIRLWGAPVIENHTSASSEKAPQSLSQVAEPSTIERFMGCSKEELKVAQKSDPVEPQLIGECLGHSGAVQMCLDIESEGFVSCGADGLLLLWKDGMRQEYQRSSIIRNLLILSTEEEIR